MASAIGHEVISLHRVAIGPIADKKLKLGEYRKLEMPEVMALYNAVKADES